MRVVLIGGGGHSGDVRFAIAAASPSGAADGVTVVGVIADTSPAPERFPDLPYLGPLTSVRDHGATHYVLAIGWPGSRAAVHERCDLAGLGALTVVHPTAVVAENAELADGVVVLDHAHISPLAAVGAHAYVGYLAAVGHDSRVGAFSSVMPAAVISGGCTIGERVLIGTNATIIEGITVGDDAVVGAGAVVVDDVAASTTVVGVPARALPEATSGMSDE